MYVCVQLMAELLETMLIVKTQRIFRENVCQYRDFAPMMLSLAPGKSAPWGMLRFPMGRAKLAKFICVSHKSNERLVARLLMSHWRITSAPDTSGVRRRPEVVISVHGSAGDFTLTNAVYRIFERGLVAAAMEANAVFVAGGYNAGVIKLIGEVFEKEGVMAPLLGIGSLPAVRQRDMLRSKSRIGTKYDTPIDYNPNEPATPYAPDDPTSDSWFNMPLDPNTTHFVLVDKELEVRDGKEEFPMGKELQLRAAIEQEYAKLMRIPIIQLIVQGGPGTLEGCLNTMLAGVPVLVLVDTGGACQAIYEYCHAKGGRDKVTDERFKKENLMKHLEGIAAKYQEIPTLLTFFKMHDQGECDEIHRTLLSAIVNNKLAHLASTPPGPEKSNELGNVLSLAVKWNAPEIAAPVIEALGGQAQAAGTDAVFKAMQRAIELGRNDFLGMLLDLPGIDAMNANLLRLYTLHEGVGIISGHAGVRKQLGMGDHSQGPNRRRRLARLVSTRSTSSTWVVGEGSMSRKSGRASARVEPHEESQREREQHELKLAEGSKVNQQYRAVAEKLFEDISLQLVRVLLPPERDAPDGGNLVPQNSLWLRDFSERDPTKALRMRQSSAVASAGERAEQPNGLATPLATRHNLAVDNLFCWAILVGNHEMADTLWQKSGRPVQMAIIGSKINDYIAENVYVDKQIYIDRAAIMEGWAMDVMDNAPSEHKAHAILSHTIHLSGWTNGAGGRSILDLAMLLDKKQFLAQRHSISLMAKLWLGQSKDSPFALKKPFSGVLELIVLLFVPIPFLNPQLTRQDANNGATSYSQSNVVYKSIIGAYAIAAGEHTKVDDQPHSPVQLKRRHSRGRRSISHGTEQTLAQKRNKVTWIELVGLFYVRTACRCLCLHYALCCTSLTVLCCTSLTVLIWLPWCGVAAGCAQGQVRKPAADAHGHLRCVHCCARLLTGAGRRAGRPRAPDLASRIRVGRVRVWQHARFLVLEHRAPASRGLDGRHVTQGGLWAHSCRLLLAGNDHAPLVPMDRARKLWSGCVRG